MAQIVSVTTTARCLFGPDIIPWAQLLSPSNRVKLQTRYKFGEVRQGVADPNGSPVQLMFLGGEFLLGGTPRAVEQLLFEPNAVQLQVVMSSDEAKDFLTDLSGALTELGPADRFSWALAHTKVYQTTAVARLSVSFAALISDQLRRFISDVAAPAVKLADAEADVSLERLSWRVNYKTQNPDVVYLPKALTIEPRAGSKPSDRLYFTQSPTEYQKHLELLTTFEKMVGGEIAIRKGRRRAKQ